MLKFYQYETAFGIPNLSQFCVKLECFLRMAGIEHEVVWFADPREGPKGKGPFIEDDGVRMGDSTFIIEYLQNKHGLDLDKNLSAEQKALSQAAKCMIEEHLYWVVVYSRWLEDDVYPQVKEVFFGSLPPVIKSIIPIIARKGVRKSLHGQGLGRHTRDEIYTLGRQDIVALADLLGDKPYIHGNEVTLIDACVYSVMINILGVPFENPLKAEAMQHANLQQHTGRMTQAYFS